MSKIQHVDPASLVDLQTRVEYDKAFLGFTAEDAAALHAAKPVVAPLVQHVVDEVYRKLLSFDITAKAFVPRQPGYEGLAPESVHELNLDHPQIRFRQDFLKGYLVKLVSMDYSQPAAWDYLDKIGIIHTGVTGIFAHRAKKPGLRVEYIHMGLLLGYVVDILLKAVTEHPDLDDKTKSAVLRAFNKLLWIQNDLFARHYVVDEETAPPPDGPLAKRLEQAKPTNNNMLTAGIAFLAAGVLIGKYCF